MTNNAFQEEVTLHTIDCQALNLTNFDLALSIILSSSKYSDNEIKTVFDNLPTDITHQVEFIISEYSKTGEYYIISSTGTTKDISQVLKRICKMRSKQV